MGFPIKTPINFKQKST